MLVERNTAIDGSGTDYHAIDVRFLPSGEGGDTKDNLLQKLGDKLKNKVDWYRVGYHQCTHRDGDGSSGPCDWVDSNDWPDGGSVPSDINDFDVS